MIAETFIDKITKSNDPKIKEINPNLDVLVGSISGVHRSDGSGTIFVFTDYLSNVSSQWEAEIGKGKSVQCPTGICSLGNEGVSSSVISTPNSIGYIELAICKNYRSWLCFCSK